MSLRRKPAGMILARRTVQVAFLLLFVGLIVVARAGTTLEPSPWLKVFFLADPLVLVATWLAAHAMPVALLAVPALAVGVLVLAIFRRRVSVPAVLLAVLATVVGAIVLGQVQGWATVPAPLCWAMATMLATLVLGRVFCGWICPLGTVHAIASRVLSAAGGFAKQQPWSPRQRTKYYLLAGLLAMALVGGHWGMIFDPLVLLYRTTVTALWPAAQWATEEGSTAIYQAQPDRGPFRPGLITEPVYHYLHENVFTIANQAFLGAGLIAAFFLGTLALNAYRPRFWCRYLCPLGALLGVLSWRPLLLRTVDQAACNQCGLCGRSCHGAASVEPGRGWMAAECLGCFHCSNACPRGALKFRFSQPFAEAPGTQTIDLGKRATLGAALGGVAALALLRITPQGRGQRFHPRARYHPLLIRPPGARDELAFLQRCTACGMCMKMCPTGGLQPAWTEAGIEGLWTPRLVPAIGHCDYNCNLCGQVCPTEAIRPLAIAEKQQTKIGLAAFDTTRCIPYAYGRDCMVCEEHCPIPDKAIYFVEVEVQDHDGRKRTIKQPRIDVKRCTGCGQCENVCIFRDLPAVRVASTSEDRHPDNQSMSPDDPAAGGDAPY